MEPYLNFDEYIHQGEPAQQEKAGYWQTAIGLQAVDGLKTSEYLHQTARRNIEGEITIDEACELVNQYYITKTAHQGFCVNNIIFARHSWYFRNALVRANYRNVAKGIDYTPVYLERFFRNLLLGEQWDLRNRYLHIHPTKEWSVQPNLNTQTSTGQVQDKLHTNNPNIVKLIRAIGEKELSVKEMMEGIGLKGRDNFLSLYLMPAISDSFIRLLYPQSPRHPRQKYLLTVKGLALYNELMKKE